MLGPYASRSVVEGFDGDEEDEEIKIDEDEDVLLVPDLLLGTVEKVGCKCFHRRLVLVLVLVPSASS